MENINQADKYRRLEELYAEMSDQEIEAMSGLMVDFTDIAKQVLRAEISKRGLGPRGLDAAEVPVKVARRALNAEICEQELDAQGLDTANQLDPIRPALDRATQK